jgi:hypothetical protein
MECLELVLRARTHISAGERASFHLSNINKSISAAALSVRLFFSLLFQWLC